MGAETAVGKILLVIGKAGAAVGKAAKAAAPVVADVASVAVPVATTGFSFAQARAAGEQRKEAQTAIDAAFQDVQSRLDKDRFANISYSTKGLELGMDTAKRIAQDTLQRQAASERGVFGGGRALEQVQRFQQQAAATYDDKATNLALRKAIGLQQQDMKAADLQLQNIAGLQTMLQNQMAMEQAYLKAGLKGVGGMLAGLQSDEPEFPDTEDDVDLTEDVVDTNTFGPGGADGGGYQPPLSSN